ncbi:family 1 polysaccharide lyase [Ophiobolus disseminans]|uniref:Family 1 polysaccharide lyase n=1 Tax=Ophiobolus disseminans TaxID=1469910 RepID=A0A6A6ZDU0_9PLEO|nr:family 1 polysaccharide lyase [Ophiobolus disseminans]
MRLLFGVALLCASTSCAAKHTLRGQTGNETTSASPPNTVRIRLNPAGVRDYADSDYATWTVPNAAKADFKSSGNTSLSFTLTAASGKLSGNSNKAVYTRVISSLGERIVGQGVSTKTDAGDDVGGVPLTLTISGLSAGQHTILAWHNAWDKLNGTAALAISVDGKNAVSQVQQTVRADNIWEAATSYNTITAIEGKDVKITYSPNQDNGGRVFLNGFEIDTPPMNDQISFPTPTHRDERVQLAGSAGGVQASWRTAGVKGATYAVYLGISPVALQLVASGLSETATTFDNVNTQDTYYWRVDVIANNTTYVGRMFTFRRARLAFPGAEGYGRFARGGRGGKVVHVTSLEDTEAEGTLRYALTKATGPRTIVFDIGGVITTKSRMSVNGQYITLAGQTAPGKGIVIQGHPLGLTGASDIIFQHIRVRPGTISNQTIDGMGMQGSNHAIFDRCSMGWTIDETFSSRDGHNITLQRSMISEPLNIAGHKNYPAGKMHGFAASIGGNVGSFHHNLIAHAEGRSWSMAGGVDANAKFAGRLDIRNNVVYNFGGRVTDGGAHEVNFVSNLYKRGPASNLTYAFRTQYEDDMPGTQQYYCDGNAMPGIFDENSVQYREDGTGQSRNIACYADVTIDNVKYQKFVAKPFFDSFVETQSAIEAYKIVLSDSGASQPTQDDHDLRIVRETLNGTATYTGSKSNKRGIIDSPADVRGLEGFPTVKRSASWDADNDGIADWWDGSTGGEGYTVLEGYLNFMAEPHAFVSPSSSIVVNLAPLAMGFVQPSFTIEGAKIGSVTVAGSKATYAAGSGGVEWLTILVKDGESKAWSRPFGVAIFAAAESLQSRR